MNDLKIILCVVGLVLGIGTVVFGIIMMIIICKEDKQLRKYEQELDSCFQKSKTNAAITEKGRAVAFAIECGLLPRIEKGWDDEAFNKFWQEYTNDLIKRVPGIIELLKL